MSYLHGKFSFVCTGKNEKKTHALKAGTELSIIHVFPDAESFDRHNEGAGERANKAFEFIVPTRREIYGFPSDQAMGILTPPEGSGISINQMSQLVDGYIRFKSE